MSQTVRLAFGSLLVGVAVLALKVQAWWLAGSVAVLSDALESTVNLATAIAALVAIRVAAAPADAKHPYGHHKAEFMSAVLEGVMIILAAILILWAAYQSVVEPREVMAPPLSLALLGLATALNAGWAWVLTRRGRKLGSPALVADGQHLWADVVSSIGVGGGLVLAVATGWWWLDPAVAVLIAMHILWSGARVVQSSLSGLLDEAAPEETLQRIRDAISTHADGAVEAHDLRTRQAGAVVFVDFHLVVPGETTVFVAHEICDRLEAAIAAQVPEAQVTIHIEPEHMSKHTGIVVLG